MSISFNDEVNDFLTGIPASVGTSGGGPSTSGEPFPSTDVDREAFRIKVREHERARLSVFAKRFVDTLERTLQERKILNASQSKSQIKTALLSVATSLNTVGNVSDAVRQAREKLGSNDSVYLEYGISLLWSGDDAEETDVDGILYPSSASGWSRSDHASAVGDRNLELSAVTRRFVRDRSERLQKQYVAARERFQGFELRALIYLLSIPEVASCTCRIATVVEKDEASTAKDEAGKMKEWIGEVCNACANGGLESEEVLRQYMGLEAYDPTRWQDLRVVAASIDSWSRFAVQMWTATFSRILDEESSKGVPFNVRSVLFAVFVCKSVSAVMRNGEPTDNVSFLNTILSDAAGYKSVFPADRLGDESRSNPVLDTNYVFTKAVVKSCNLRTQKSLYVPFQKNPIWNPLFPGNYDEASQGPLGLQVEPDDASLKDVQAVYAALTRRLCHFDEQGGWFSTPYHQWPIENDLKMVRSTCYDDCSSENGGCSDLEDEYSHLKRVTQLTSSPTTSQRAEIVKLGLLKCCSVPLGLGTSAKLDQLQIPVAETKWPPPTYTVSTTADYDRGKLLVEEGSVLRCKQYIFGVTSASMMGIAIEGDPPSSNSAFWAAVCKMAQLSSMCEQETTPYKKKNTHEYQECGTLFLTGKNAADKFLIYASPFSSYAYVSNVEGIVGERLFVTPQIPTPPATDPNDTIEVFAKRSEQTDECPEVQQFELADVSKLQTPLFKDSVLYKPSNSTEGDGPQADPPNIPSAQERPPLTDVSKLLKQIHGVAEEKCVERHATLMHDFDLALSRIQTTLQSLLKTKREVDAYDMAMRNASASSQSDATHLFQALPDSVERDRRDAVWSDALRELAVSADPLFVFLKTLAGILHDDVSTIIKLEDRGMEMEQQQRQQRRKEAMRASLDFSQKTMDAVVSALFRQSNFRLNVDDDADRQGRQAAKQLVVVSDDEVQKVRDLAKDTSNTNFFAAQAQLTQFLQERKGRPVPLDDLIQGMRDVVQAQMRANLKMMDDVDVGSERGALDLLSRPRNSLVIRMRNETFAAIRQAYDMLTVEMRKRGLARFVPSAYTCVEGPSRLLTDQFAALCAYTLAQSRLFSSSASVYVSATSARSNAEMLRVALQKTVRRATEMHRSGGGMF